MTIMNIIVIVILILAALGGWIDWKSMLRRRYSPDVTKAELEVDVGGLVDIVNAELTSGDAEGFLYDYTWHGHKLTLAVPLDYPTRINLANGRRIIPVTGGMAAPKTDKECSPEGAFWVSALVRTDLHTRAMESFTAKKSGPDWKMWLIIGGLALAGFAFYHFFMQGTPVSTPAGIHPVPPGVTAPAVTPGAGSPAIVPHTSAGPWGVV